MDDPKPSTSKQAQANNNNRNSSPQVHANIVQAQIKTESDSSDEISFENDSNLGEEFVRMETDEDEMPVDQRAANHPQNNAPNQQLNLNNNRRQRNARGQREVARENRPRPASPRRNRRPARTPSDDSSSSSSDEEPYIPYFADAKREADRIRQLRAQKRLERKQRGLERNDKRALERRDRKHHSTSDRYESRSRDRRHESDRRRERSRDGRRSSSSSRGDQRRSHRRNDSRDQPPQPQIIQIMIPYPEHAMMHGMPPYRHGGPPQFRPPGPMFPPFHGPGPMMAPGYPFHGPMRPYYRPHFGGRLPPPPPLYPLRFPPNRFRPNRPPNSNDQERKKPKENA